MKTRHLGIILAAICVTTLGLRSARAGCIEKCDAVTKITASLTDAPSCVTVTAEPDNGCVCYGSATVKNDCAFELTAEEFTWADAKSALPAGESRAVNFEGEEVGAGDHHEELKISGDGKTFTLVVDYTVAAIDRDFSTGCSASGSGAGAAISGLAVAASALLLARRRRSRRA